MIKGLSARYAKDYWAKGNGPLLSPRAVQLQKKYGLEVHRVAKHSEQNHLLFTTVRQKNEVL